MTRTSINNHSNNTRKSNSMSISSLFLLLLLSMTTTTTTLAYKDCLLDSECRHQVCLKWPDICGEGGTCHLDLEHGYPYFRCDCPPGQINLTPDVCIHSSIQTTPGGTMSMGGTCMDDSECDINATCLLAGGSVYKCQCHDGYVGDGYTCSSKTVSSSSSGIGVAGSSSSSSDCPSNFCTGNGASCVYEPENNKAYCVCSDNTHVGATDDCQG